jgi:hypothetical protein
MKIEKLKSRVKITMELIMTPVKTTETGIRNLKAVPVFNRLTQ